MASPIDKAAKDAEVLANFRAFEAKLPELMATREGKFALLRQAEVVEFFDTARDALAFAQKTFPDGRYSVQEVTTRVIDLGWLSRFGHAAADRSV